MKEAENDLHNKQKKLDEAHAQSKQAQAKYDALRKEADHHKAAGDKAAADAHKHHQDHEAETNKAQGHHSRHQEFWEQAKTCVLAHAFAPLLRAGLRDWPVLLKGHEALVLKACVVIFGGNLGAWRATIVAPQNTHALLKDASSGLNTIAQDVQAGFAQICARGSLIEILQALLTWGLVTGHVLTCAAVALQCQSSAALKS